MTEQHDTEPSLVEQPVEQTEKREVAKSIRKKYTLERPWVRRELIRHLATGELKQTELAKKYDVADGAITEFKRRHELEIEEVRNNLEDEFAGLWVAKKANRIASYQEDYELLEALAKPELAKLKATILKSVAEELGQLPPKLNVAVVQPITYNVEGVDKDQLT